MRPTHQLLPFLPRRRLSFLSAAIAFALLLGGAGANGAQQAATQPQVTLPPITAETLAKTKVKLPGEFKTDYNLLLLPFDSDQQPQVNSWISGLTQAHIAKEGLQIWVLPVGPHENVLYRWWLNSSMRSDSPPEMLPYTVPLYLNKERFRKTLQIANEKQITVLLVDRMGHVLWRSTGAADPAKWDAVRALIASHATASSASPQR